MGRRKGWGMRLLAEGYPGSEGFREVVTLRWGYLNAGYVVEELAAEPLLHGKTPPVCPCSIAAPPVTSPPRPLAVNPAANRGQKGEGA
jgi:hypothetical protein